MGKNTTPAKRVVRDERAALALTLRKAGATYEQIAQRVGISKQRAHQLVMEELRKLAEDCGESASKVRTLELERLDRMLLALWERATNGDEKAIDRILRIQERRAKMLGLDAAATVDITLRAEWEGLAAEVVAALASFPEARAVVAAVLMKGGNQPALPAGPTAPQALPVLDAEWAPAWDGDEP